jgi:hypothetical protein
MIEGGTARLGTGGRRNQARERTGRANATFTRAARGAGRRHRGGVGSAPPRAAAASTELYRAFGISNDVGALSSGNARRAARRVKNVAVVRAGPGGN